MLLQKRLFTFDDDVEPIDRRHRWRSSVATRRTHDAHPQSGHRRLLLRPPHDDTVYEPRQCFIENAPPHVHRGHLEHASLGMVTAGEGQGEAYA